MPEKFWIGVLMLLVFADALTTAIALQHGAYETNPRLRWLIRHAGRSILLVTHGLMLLALWRYRANLHPFGLVPLCILFGWATVQNLRVGWQISRKRNLQ